MIDGDGGGMIGQEGLNRLSFAFTRWVTIFQFHSFLSAPKDLSLT